MRNNFAFYLNILLICLGWSTSVNAQVLSSEKVTVSVGNRQSWTGRNGTGNLSYYGCDRTFENNLGEGKKQVDEQDKCIYLTGGKVTCRDGICQTVWQHKKYSYVVSSPITEATGQFPSTLTIYLDSKIILEDELYPQPFDNI